MLLILLLVCMLFTLIFSNFEKKYKGDKLITIKKIEWFTCFAGIIVAVVSVLCLFIYAYKYNSANDRIDSYRLENTSISKDILNELTGNITYDTYHTLEDNVDKYPNRVIQYVTKHKLDEDDTYISNQVNDYMNNLDKIKECRLKIHDAELYRKMVFIF